MDLGSGEGDLVRSSLELYPLKKAVGIELAYERHLEAVQKQAKGLLFIHGDVCDESEEILEVYKEVGSKVAAR